MKKIYLKNDKRPFWTVSAYHKLKTNVGKMELLAFITFYRRFDRWSRDGIQAMNTFLEISKTFLFIISFRDIEISIGTKV